MLSSLCVAAISEPRTAGYAVIRKQIAGLIGYPAADAGRDPGPLCDRGAQSSWRIIASRVATCPLARAVIPSIWERRVIAALTPSMATSRIL